MNRANNGIANGDLIAALSGLYSADVALENISHSYESSRAIIQPKIEELKKYIPSNLINICNKREISFAQKVEGIKYALSSYEVSCSLSDEKRKKLQAFVLRNNLSINPAQEFSSEVDSLVNGLSGQLKKYSEEKSLVLRDVESKHEQIIEKSKNQLEYSQRQNRSYPSMGNAAQVTKAIEEYSLVNGSYEQDKSKVAGEYDTQILEVTARRDNYKKSSSELIAKINDRTMTRVEYKQLKKLNFEAKK